MNLVFITPRNPISEDLKGHYSRIRFYSDTIIKFAEELNAERVKILYHYSDLKDGYSYKHNEVDDTHLLGMYYHDPEKFENCYYLDKSLLENHHICVFESIDTYLREYESDDSVVMFGIMNASDDIMNDMLQKYSEVVKRSTHGYFYLSSDAELSSHQYIESGRVGFLSKFKDIDHIFKEKLLGVIVTEITDPNIINAYEEVGIHSSKIYYLPMIVDISKRMNNSWDPEFNRKNGRVMILRNFDKWMKYPEFLESVRDHFDIYESSLPAVRRKYIDIVEQYGGTYKNAKYWTIEKMKWKLWEYSFYMGMSTPGSDRFTYKIIEATDSGVLCILPKISLKSLGLSDSYSQQLLKDYEDVMTLDVKTDELFRYSLKNLSIKVNSESEYMYQYNRQKSFVKDYFDINSSNINYNIQKIIGGIH